MVRKKIKTVQRDR